MPLVFLSAHPSPGEARLVAGGLEAAGVPVEVRREALATLGGELPLTETWTELWVPAAQLEQARALLAAQAASAGDASQSRPCPRCREENPGTFELCWACGSDLPPLAPRRHLAAV
jgi:hypothetical protein